jgi:hypothetical protein
MSTNEGESKVIKHGKKLIVTVGAVSALAFGGAALANGGSTPVKTAAQPPVEQKSGPDRDKVQSGDQTTPDVAASKADRASSAESPSAPDTDPVQSGDQSTPDTPGSAEQPETPGSVEQPETSGETGSEVANDDGPGGHADEPGNANADHQFNGQE